MTLKSGAGTMLRWASEALSSSALRTIVRNLYIAEPAAVAAGPLLHEEDRPR